MTAWQGQPQELLPAPMQGQPLEPPQEPPKPEPSQGPPPAPPQPDRQALIRMIDHTLLRADATASDIQQLCSEARHWGFAAACVNSCYVAQAARLLAGSGVAVCSVVGFPLGAMSSRAKAAEAKLAVDDGASELDMVIALGAAKSGEWQAVEDDIAAVVEAAGAAALVKVIIECCLLTDPEKVAACQAAVRAGAAFVKTSTGFSTGGATVDDLSLMRRTVGEGIGVKASGGIKTIKDMLTMYRAGANRFGTSSGASIAEGIAQQPTAAVATNSSCNNQRQP